ncbi:hypothetical protein CsSME_00042123 [Camellia sinensis var. sinensis]
MQKTAQAWFAGGPSSSNDLQKSSSSLLADWNAYAAAKESEDADSSLGFDLVAAVVFFLLFKPKAPLISSNTHIYIVYLSSVLFIPFLHTITGHFMICTRMSSLTEADQANLFFSIGA